MASSGDSFPLAISEKEIVIVKDGTGSIHFEVRKTTDDSVAFKVKTMFNHVFRFAPNCGVLTGPVGKTKVISVTMVSKNIKSVEEVSKLNRAFILIECINAKYAPECLVQPAKRGNKGKSKFDFDWSKIPEKSMICSLNIRLKLDSIFKRRLVNDVTEAVEKEEAERLKKKVEEEKAEEVERMKQKLETERLEKEKQDQMEVAEIDKGEQAPIDDNNENVEIDVNVERHAVSEQRCEIIEEITYIDGDVAVAEESEKLPQMASAVNCSMEHVLVELKKIENEAAQVITFLYSLSFF